MRLLPLILCLCLQAQASGETGKVHGKVSELGGGGVEGCVVHFWDLTGKVSALADAQGRYQLTLPAGQAVIHFEAEGFTATARSLEVIPGKDQELDVALARVEFEAAEVVVKAFRLRLRELLDKEQAEIRAARKK